MKGYMPQQVELWYVIPAIRKEFAKVMISKGMTQKQAAERLGITEAAVSQYMKNKRASDVDFDNRMKSEIDASVNHILAGSSVMKEMQNVCKLAKKRGIVCRISKKLGYAPKGCKECFG
ncbi:MAG: hypothetical protein DRO99_04765 [Candidatus Aenigmatarchaeota archaeon]|nr:MAG: hypothetical protein DRO99_04765 [Candidatus Aenigmarchaeota archaeon]